MTKIDIEDIATETDLAAMIGVRANVLGNWRRRYPDFPKPFNVASRGSPLYRKSEFVAWYRGRLSPEMLAALQKRG